MIVPVLKENFDNGLTILCRHTPRNLMAEFHLMMPGGQIREPAHLGGLSNLTLELAVKGTRSHSYAQFSERIESLGGSIWGNDSQDYGTLSLSIPASEAEKALPLFAEAALEPSYPAEELDKERKATLALIKNKEEHPFTIAYEKLNSLLFKDHGYGKPEIGTRETVSRISRKDIVLWRKAWLRPERTFLSLASPIPPQRLLKQLKKLFDKQWGQNGSLWPRCQRPIPPQREKRVKLKKPFKQAFLFMGFAAPELSHPFYTKTKILNAILGGGMSARLFRNIREKHGLAYDVGSLYPTRALGGSLVIHCGLQASKIPKAEDCVRDMLDELVKNTPPTEEIEEAKRYLRGTYFMDHQTNSKKAFYMGWWEIMGKGAAFDAQYPEEIASVTTEDVQEAARAIFREPPQIVELYPN